MPKQNWTFKILIRYSLLQLPAIVIVIGGIVLIQKWDILSLWMSLLIVIVWIVKDIILFPFVWRAYDWDQKEYIDTMIGMNGITQEKLDPMGYIMIRGELWKAEIIKDFEFIEKGKKVQVKKVKGLTLFVKPILEEDE